MSDIKQQVVSMLRQTADGIESGYIVVKEGAFSISPTYSHDGVRQKEIRLTVIEYGPVSEIT